jgi:DNA-binding MarR family transcriptional regulator
MDRPLSLDRFLPYRLSVASNAVSGRIATTYRRRFNLKVPEWRLIAILAEQARLTPLMLAERTRMDKIAVSRAARSLIERQIIAADDNPGDGRSHFLSLTPAGHALYADIAPLARATESELFATLTPQERLQFEAMLRRIEAAAASPV